MLSSIKEALARADLTFVGLALGVYLASVVVVALRWRVVLEGVTGRRPPLLQLVLATFASAFVNNITPTGRLGGEACRVAALRRLGCGSVPRAMATIAYERLSEAPSIVAIAVVTLVVVGRLRIDATAVPWAWWMAIGAGFVAAVLLRTRVAIGWRRLRDRLRALHSFAIPPSTLAVAVAVSAAIWILDVVRLRLVAAAFDAPVSFAQTATLTAVTIVAGLVPTIGGLGVIEGGLVAALIGLGVAPADAVAITIVERSMSYGIATVAGLGSLSLLGGRSLWKAVRVGPTAAQETAT